MVQVSNAQIAPGVVTTSKIATGAVTSGDIADGAITSTKPAESFMKRITLLDNPAGNALGWTHDNVDTSFTISEPARSSDNSVFIDIVADGGGGEFYECDVMHLSAAKTSTVTCISPVDGGSKLHYVVENLPPHVP
jgi:hypothetical protein